MIRGPADLLGVNGQVRRGGAVRPVLFLSLLVLLAASIAGARAASAAFPGQNGRIAFVKIADANMDIYSVEPDGSGPTRLTTDPGLDDEPAWSADGSRIAFTTDRNGDYDIFVMNADGTGQTNLTPNPGPDLRPSWSPDGTRIAFASYREGGAAIYVMNADGSDQTRLAEGTSPAWSPDGTRIAFSWGERRCGCINIYLMNPDGSELTRLTDEDPSVYDHVPSWSPDGDRIAFESDRADFNYEIWVINQDGTDLTRLTHSQVVDAQPVWAPDGTKIAFTSGVSPQTPGAAVYTMNPDGSSRAFFISGIQPDWQSIPMTPPRSQRGSRAGCRVPVVVGSRLRRGRIAIPHAGCSVGKVRMTGALQRRGIVIKQSVRPGARLPRTARVGLVISSGQPRSATPPPIG